jgi:hypothetical protein
MANIKLDFSSHSSYQIEIGDGIPDLSQLKKGIIVINQKRGQMTWSKIPMNESASHLIFKHRADLFLENQQNLKFQIENWIDDDYKKRCDYFLKHKDKYKPQGELSVEDGDVDVLWDDTIRKITIIGDHTEIVAKKYGLPDSTNGSFGSSGRQFFYENLDQNLYNLVKLRMIADELDATWLDDVGARD